MVRLLGVGARHPLRVRVQAGNRATQPNVSHVFHGRPIHGARDEPAGCAESDRRSDHGHRWVTIGSLNLSGDDHTRVGRRLRTYKVICCGSRLRSFPPDGQHLQCRQSGPAERFGWPGAKSRPPFPAVKRAADALREAATAATAVATVPTIWNHGSASAAQLPTRRSRARLLGWLPVPVQRLPAHPDDRGDLRHGVRLAVVELARGGRPYPPAPYDHIPSDGLRRQVPLPQHPRPGQALHPG